LTCALCGARLGIPTFAKPELSHTIVAGNQRMRILTLEGVEIHRCAVPIRR
jgi:hypothetical protein